MRYNILIVDEEELLTNVLKENLKKSLPESVLLSAENGERALEYIQENDIKIAFLDIRAALLNGANLVQTINKHHPYCPIVFLTSYRDFQYVRGFIKLGAADYLLKPFSQTALFLLLQKLLPRQTVHDIQRQGDIQTYLNISKLSDWLDGQLLVHLISTGQDWEIFDQELKNDNIYFGSGIFAVIKCCCQEQQHLMREQIRGENWRAELKLLFYSVEEYLFVLVLGPKSTEFSVCLTEKLRQISHNIDKEGQNATSDNQGDRSFPFSCGVGGLFYDLRNAQAACLDAFHQMLLCSVQNSFKRSELLVVINRYETFLIEILWRERLADLQPVHTIYHFFKQLNYNLRSLRDEFCHFFDYILEVTINAGEINRSMVYKTILSCDTEERLLAAGELLMQEIFTGNTTESVTSEAETDLVFRIKQYLEDHLQEDLTLAKVAIQMGDTRLHSGSWFLRLFGKSFKQFLTDLRIEKARVLLSDSDYSVKKVGEMVGVPDAAYFTSVFRKVMGITPTAYRARLLVAEQSDRDRERIFIDGGQP